MFVSGMQSAEIAHNEWALRTSQLQPPQQAVHFEKLQLNIHADMVVYKPFMSRSPADQSTILAAIDPLTCKRSPDRSKTFSLGRF